MTDREEPIRYATLDVTAAVQRAAYVKGERLREAWWVLVPVVVVLLLDLWRSCLSGSWMAR